MDPVSVSSRSIRVIVVEVQGEADVDAVDLLASLQLVARRHRACLLLRTDDEQLLHLLELAGLSEAVPRELQPGRQTETPEQGRVEEVVHVRNPPP